MDADSFLDELRDAHETELTRLGSSKAVYAFTDGEMTGDAVRTGTARELHALAPVLREWSGSAPGEAAALFADIASFAAETAETFDSEVVPGEPGSLTHVTAEPLTAVGGDARPAGVAAAFLVLEELAGQLVGFFVGDADRKSADEFREFRTELAGHRDEAAALLDTNCESETDWAVAEEVGRGIVDGAYDWYVETLESMGVEPKNIC